MVSLENLQKYIATQSKQLTTIRIIKAPTFVSTNFKDSFMKL